LAEVLSGVYRYFGRGTFGVYWYFETRHFRDTTGGTFRRYFRDLGI
jgi:hypothetical protein